MALTANREVDHFVDQEIRRYPVAAGAHVYKGGLVGLNATGYARPLVAGDTCVGLAYEEADNSAGVDGERHVRVYTIGDFLVDLTGATRADVGKAVYATDDETLTFDLTSASFVGVCVDVPSSGQIILRLDPFHAASGG